MIDWEEVWNRIRPSLDEAVRAVKTAHPGIYGAARWSREVANQWFPFQAYASFIYDPRAGDEQLVIQFRCSESSRGVWAADVWPYFPSEVAARHAVGISIETGCGEILASLPPRLLPEDEGSPDYSEAVLGYVDEAVGFIREHLALIIDATARAAADG